MRATRCAFVLLAAVLAACAGEAASPTGGARTREVLVVGKSGGCGNVFVYRAGADGSRFLTVRIDAKGAGVGASGSRRFDVAASPSHVVVELHVYPQAPAEPPYCTDDVDVDTKPEVWKAEAGIVTLDLAAATPPDARSRATVRVRDLRLRGPDGARLFVGTATIDDVVVGWNPG